VKILAAILFVIAVIFAIISMSGNAIQAIGPAIIALTAMVGAGFAWIQPPPS
jgi:hypothetical protein